MITVKLSCVGNMTTCMWVLQGLERSSFGSDLTHTKKEVIKQLLGEGSVNISEVLKIIEEIFECRYVGLLKTSEEYYFIK